MRDKESTVWRGTSVLFKYGGSSLQRRLKFREREDVDEVVRLLLTEVAGNPTREHTTSVESCLRPSFLDGARRLSLAFSVTRHCPPHVYQVGPLLCGNLSFTVMTTG